MFTRRTATVTISAPEAACACAMTGCDEYLPVPTMSRDLNVRPAMLNGKSFLVFPASSPVQPECLTTPFGGAAADKIHDLDFVAVADQRRGKRVALDDDHVVFDRNASGIDVQPFQQLLHRHRLLEIVRVPVERNT